MFKSTDKVGNIKLLEHKLKNLEEQSSTNKTDYWQKLSDVCSKLSADQLNYINNSEKVIDKKNKMMEAFNLFLFEKYKNDFVEIEAFKNLCADYVDTIQDVIKDYSKQVENTIEENKKLKQKLAELEKKINEKSSTKRA